MTTHCNVCVKLGLHRGEKCDPEKRDALRDDHVGISAVQDVVRTHLPGIETTPSIRETCLYTVNTRSHMGIGLRSCLSNEY